jgi:hypothetical protein
MAPHLNDSARDLNEGWAEVRRQKRMTLQRTFPPALGKSTLTTRREWPRYDQMREKLSNV